MVAAALLMPGSPVIELLALDFREVCVLPVLIAEADSATRIVTTSSTRLARKSRVRSIMSE